MIEILHVEYLCLHLQKAFGTVDHKPLLKKRAHYGIRGNANGWYRSYLQHRSQYVSNNSFDSGCRHSKYGVHKGSVLGTFFFVINIIGLNFIVSFC